MNRPRRLALAFAIAMTTIPAAIALAAPPVNDDFAAAAVLATAGGTITGTNLGSDSEAGEPDHASTGYGALHSVWYSWTPETSGEALVDTCNSGFNTRLGVYTGSAVDALTPVVANEDSGGPGCPGTAWAELSFAATAGITYRIAVDTSGGVDSSGRPDYTTSNTRGPFELTLKAPPRSGSTTNPGTPVSSRLVRHLRFPRLIASCGDDTPTGNEHCTKGPFEFDSAATVERFRDKLAHLGIASYVEDVTPVAAGLAANSAQREILREHGGGGEITRARIKLLFSNGGGITLDQGGRYDIEAGLDTVKISYSFFDLAKDKAAIEDEREQLRKEAEREAAKRGPGPPKSRCLPIAAGESEKQIAARFPKPGETSFSDAITVLGKLGCDTVVEKTTRGRPSIEYSYVKDVLGTNAKEHTVRVLLAQPGSHDFIFTIRENPAEFTSQANRANIPIGTDGHLTVSDKQFNRFTVQVIERSTGRLVAGIPVSFAGKTEQTDANGDATFVSKLEVEDDYRLSAEFKGLEGWRTVRAVHRGKRTFTSMAGRRITLSTRGVYGGASEAELNFAKALPVVPANLGSGRVGEVDSIPTVRQSDVTVFDAAGGQFTGQHNVVSVENNSDALVGARPGLVALGGGFGQQVGGRVAREGIPNPFSFLATIVGGLKSAIDNSVSNIRAVLGGPDQAAIAAIAQALNAPRSNLISDKGLGVIATGGGNLIGQAGGNLISDKGLGVISVGGGNLIGQAGGNLIGQAGGNVISNDGCSCMPVYGGNVISTGGGN